MSELQIELISVGDEILLGHTLDTNSNWIANRLSENGFRLRWHSTVGDNASDMRHQLKRAWNRADVVIVTGGLGPTHDDITRPVLTSFFDDELVTRQDLVQRIEERFTHRGLKPPFGYDSMAEFPTRADPILNQHGSAPGIHFHEEGKNLFALPGVPVEMKEMISNFVLPKLERQRKGVYRYHIFRTTGIGESNLNEMIGDPLKLEPVKLAYLPSLDHGVTVRLSLTGNDADSVDAELNKRFDKVRLVICDYIYTEDKRSLPEVLLEMMRKRNLKLTVAESCTGGMICNRLVSITGSSDVFERGFITYWNEAKIDLLGVDPAIIDRYGAVSEETATAMAEGARERACVDLALSVTGVAGPTGGTTEKPVGLVFIGLADSKETIVEHHRFNGNRETNRRRSTQAALTLLWKRLK